MFSSGIVTQVGWRSYVWLAMGYVLVVSLVAYVTSGARPPTPDPAEMNEPEAAAVNGANVHVEVQQQGERADPNAVTCGQAAEMTPGQCGVKAGSRGTLG